MKATKVFFKSWVDEHNVYMHNRIYYSVLKGNDFLTHATTWINLENITRHKMTNTCIWFHLHAVPAAAAAKSLQSCPTLWDPIDGSPPGSTVPGILQARTLEWVAISFSNARKWKAKVKLLSCVRLLATPWTEAHLALRSTGFSRQEYWSGVPLPSPHAVPRVVKFTETESKVISKARGCEEMGNYCLMSKEQFRKMK